ncbi:hypothetical protein ACMD2_24950, partial [Ananas comosus]
RPNFEDFTDIEEEGRREKISIVGDLHESVYPKREAHLWYVVPDELKDASQLKKYMELLSSCERERVLSMNGEHLQKDLMQIVESIHNQSSSKQANLGSLR